MWWQQQTLDQWLFDFLSDALRRRGINALLCDQHTDPFDLLSDPRSLGFSSLDMVQLASRFAACLGLDKTGLSDLLLARRSAKGWLDVARRSLQANDQTISFYSSGSTAGPKLSRHPLNKLQAEAHYFARTLPSCQRVVSIVPSHHIYGFIWGILLPAEMNVPRVFVDAATSLPTTWAQQLNEHDMIVATPDTWQSIMELDINLPLHFIGISSTAALAPETAGFFRSRYPNATLAEIYGSTETAGLAWRGGNSTGFKLLPWWQLTQAQHRTTVISAFGDDQYLLQDNIHVHADGSIQVLGRVDNVIQMAGHNINLDTLAEKISQHPELASARIYAEQQDISVRLHYFLVLTNEPVDLAHWCRAFSNWLEQHLGDTPPPSSVVVSASLPRGINNKIVTWEPHHYSAVIGVYRSDFLTTAMANAIDKTPELR